MRLLPALALMILFSPADSARAGGDTRVMEIVTFRLVAAASEADFLAAAVGTEGPLRSQSGFLGRSLTRCQRQSKSEPKGSAKCCHFGVGEIAA